MLTAKGRKKFIDASISGSKVKLSEVALGDGGGSYYEPSESQTALRNEVWRGKIDVVKIDKDNPHWIIVEAIVPATDGGFMIREMGLFDDEGELIVIGKYPETYKPIINDGSAKDVFLNIKIEVSNTSTVNLTIDPTVGMATKKDIKSLDGRVSVLERDKVKRYGVKFSGSNPNGTRVEDAVGMVANVAVDDEIVVNDFDKISFFNRPICCGYHDEDGKFHVNAYRGEPGFAWDGSNGEVFYECTPFFYKGDLHNYISVSASPLEGYELAPMFKNGHDKVYCPVFPIAMVDGKATSRAGVFPTSGSMNNHMANARTYHAKAHTETMAVRISEYMLQLVEFATKDLQSVMMGASYMAYSNSDAAITGETSVNRIILPKSREGRFVTGQTVSIGTSYTSSSVAKNRIITDIVEFDEENIAIYFDGDPVDIAEGNVIASRAWKNGATNVVLASSGSPVSNTSGKYPCVWRGKVDPWGGGWSAICDVLVKKEGDEGPYIPYYLEDPTKYVNGDITDDYVKLSYKLADKNGYVKTLGRDERFKHVRLPNRVGASSSTYLAAYYWIQNSPLVRAVFAGGYWNDGRTCSPVSFHCNDSPSNSALGRLSRLFVTP